MEDFENALTRLYVWFDCVPYPSSEPIKPLLKDEYGHRRDRRGLTALELIPLLASGHFRDDGEYELTLNLQEFKYLLPRFLELMAAGELHYGPFERHPEKLIMALSHQYIPDLSYTYHHRTGPVTTANTKNADDHDEHVLLILCLKELWKQILSSPPPVEPYLHSRESEKCAPFLAERFLCIIAHGSFSLQPFLDIWASERSLNAIRHLALMIENASYESGQLSYSDLSAEKDCVGEMKSAFFWSLQAPRLTQLEDAFFTNAYSEAEGLDQIASAHDIVEEACAKHEAQLKSHNELLLWLESRTNSDGAQ